MHFQVKENADAISSNWKARDKYHKFKTNNEAVDYKQKSNNLKLKTNKNIGNKKYRLCKNHHRIDPKSHNQWKQKQDTKKKKKTKTKKT